MMAKKKTPTEQTDVSTETLSTVLTNNLKEDDLAAVTEILLTGDPSTAYCNALYHVMGRGGSINLSQARKKFTLTISQLNVILDVFKLNSKYYTIKYSPEIIVTRKPRAPKLTSGE
jgi:hypothetical protein